jgi:alkylation response protein AidB-like acyl-CoA dehydrogenase
MLTLRAAWLARQGKPFVNAEGSMWKLVTGETAVRVTEQAIRSSAATATRVSTLWSAGTATRRF